MYSLLVNETVTEEFFPRVSEQVSVFSHPDTATLLTLAPIEPVNDKIIQKYY